uniref:SURF1-like protein n=1 Tax=Lotharella oceanica TaxID=641309 RepID=A0A7S2TYU2_9EUKA
MRVLVAVSRRTGSANTRFMRRRQLSVRATPTASEGKKGAGDMGRYMGIGVFLGLAGFTANLGYWQVQRKQWKIDLIEDRKTKLTREPASFHEVLCAREAGDDLEEYDFRQVTVEGVLDYGRELLVGPRSAPSSVDARDAGNRGGYFLVTPMKTDEGPVMLVNRGWVRADLKDKVQAEQQLGDGKCKLTGVLRKGETPSAFIPTKGDSNRTWLYVDPDAMLQQAYGREVDKDGSSSSSSSTQETLLLDVLSPEPTGWPARKVREEYIKFHTTPEMHTVYAGTWFSLAAALVGLTFVRFRKADAVKSLRKHATKK